MSVSDQVNDTRETGAARVFISYSRRDLAFVDRLAAGLEARGVTAATDRKEIYSFEDWWKRIETLIAEAETIIFVLSPDSLASDVCTKEVEYATTLRKRFAPIVCRPVDDRAVPAALAELNFIVFDATVPFEAGIDKLVEALSTDIGWVRTHTRIGLDAKAWADSGRPNGLLLRSPRLEEAEHWIASRPANAPMPSDDARRFVLESRRAATRRRNVVTSSLAAGLVIAVALAGVAFWQRGQAIQQRQIAVAQTQLAVTQERLAIAATQRAEHNLSAAKTTINGLIYDVAQGLNDVRGMRIETIHQILNTVQHSMSGLLAAAPDDEDLLRSRATMLLKFAGTYMSAGDLDDAAKSVKSALDVDEGLVKRRRSVRALNDMAIALGTAGDVELQMGHEDAALQDFTRSLDLHRALSAQFPKDAEMRASVSAMLERVGSLELLQGRPDQASAAFRESLDERRVQSLQHPDDCEAQAALSIILNKVGDLALESGDPNQAKSLYSESAGVLRNNIKLQPDNKKYSDLLSGTLQRVGNATMQAGDLTTADKAFQDSVDIERALIAQDPRDVASRRGLSISLTRLGDAKLAAGADRAVALKLYVEALDTTRQVSSLDPSDAQSKNDLATYLGRVGMFKAGSGDLDAALVDLHEAVKVARDVAQANPSDAKLKRDLMTRLTDLGDLARGKGDNDEMLADYQEALSGFRQIAANNPGSPGAQRDLSVVLQRSAMAKSQSGDKEGAAEDFDQELAIDRWAAKNDPNDLDAQWSLVQGLAQAAATLGTRAYLDEAVERSQQLEAAGRLSAPRKSFADRLKAVVDRYR